MFDHLFENRNRTVTNLLKLSDCLGRSLRENVELFAIDSEKEEVAFLTESGKVVVGNYVIDEGITLDNIRVQDVEMFSDNKVFDSFVNEKVTSFLSKINSDEFTSAEGSFSDILTLWENRLKFDNVKKKLEEKVAVFSESQSIIETDEFQRFVEVLPQFLEFLGEKKEEIVKFKEIENSIKLSNSVSKAFNFPKLELDSLHESSYSISKGINESIYELLCKQELVKKELLESKRSFDSIWATNPLIKGLATLIFESEEEKVVESLVEAVVEIPFLALATKKQLFECIDNALGLSEYSVSNAKDIKAYASRLFEMKKPMKVMVLNLLNEKYGINVQNLKGATTFNSLATTQIVIFESLARLAPKNSVVKDALTEMGKMLKNKNGVEVIDVNDLLQECLSSCDYDTFISDFTLVEGVEFESILDDDVTAASLLAEASRTLKEKKDKDKEDEKDTDDQGAEDETSSKKEIEDKEKEPGCDGDYEDDSSSDKINKKKKKSDKKKDMKEEEASDEDAPDEDPEDKPLTQDEFLEGLKDLDSLVDTLSPDKDADKEKE
tara:strand:+ start:5221 stop:6876 length:1656 start_codon:yes stop_codon:yes gene_type:complete